MAVDGVLRFSTKIDADGFIKGTDKLSSKAIELKNKISAAEREVKNLTKELEQMADTPIKSDAIASLEKQVDKAKSKFNELTGKADELFNKVRSEQISMGFGDSHLDEILAENKEWQKLQEQITEADSALLRYERELESAKATESQITGKDTAEYAQKKQKIEDLSAQIEVYKAKLRETTVQEQATATSEKAVSKQTVNTAKIFQKLSKALKEVASRLKNAFKRTVVNSLKSLANHAKKTNSQMGILSKSLKRIKQAIAGLLLYKVLRGGLNGLTEEFNNLAKQSPKVNESLSALISSLEYLKNSLSSAFAPILNVVTPILTKFMDIISQVTNKVGHFIATLTGQTTYTQAIKVQKDYAESLDDTAKATENLEKENSNLASFDELNVMQQQDTSKSNDTGANSGTIFETVPTVFSDFASKLKEAFTKGNFNEIGQLVADKLNQAMKSIKWSKIRNTAKKWASNIADLLNGFVENLDWFLTGTTIGNGLMTAVDFAYSFITKSNWPSFGTAIGNIINGLISSFDASKFAKTLSNLVTGIFTALTSLIKTIDWEKIGDSIVSFLTNIKWEKIGNVAVNLIKAISKAITKVDFKAIGEAFRKGISKINWKGIWDGLVDVATNTIKAITDFFGLKGVSTSALNKALKNISKPISEIYEAIKDTMSKLLPPIINNLLPAIVNLAGDILKGITPIIKALTPVAETLINLVSSVVQSLSPVLPKIGQVIADAVNALTPIITPLAQLISDIVQFLAPVLDGILTVVSGICNFVGSITSVVGQMLGELVGNNEPTISTKLQEELDHLSQVSDDLVTVQNNIDSAIQGVDESLASTSDDLQYIDDLKNKMEELLEKSTLTDEDMTELNTIADLISEKVPDFQKTWDDMIEIDENGKITFKTNKDEMIKSIDNVISSLKQQYATEALREQYKELYEQQIQANKDVASATQEVTDKYDEYCYYSAARRLAEQDLQKVLEAGPDYEGDLAKAQEKAMETAEKARTEEEKYRGELEKAETNLLKTKGKQEELNEEMEKVSGITDVVSGSFDVATDSLDKLRDTFDEGFINADELKEQYNMTAEELYKSSKSMAERTNEGYTDGIEKGAEELKKSGVEIGDNVISGAKEALGIHSPSAEAYDLASYTIEGFTNRIDKDKSAENSMKKLMKRVLEAMKKTISNIDFSAIFTQMWNPLKIVLNNMLYGFENFFNYINYGLNSMINNLNAVSKSVGQTTGQSYWIYPNFSNISIPKLATGAYIPANYGEFLAVLGDNKREPEIVSPESSIKRMVTEAMTELGITGGGDINLTINLDGEPIYKDIIKRNNAEKKRRGKSLLA